MIRQLPFPLTADGKPRRVGVEVEFGGLAQDDAARIVQTRFGGTLVVGGAQETAIEGSAIGDVEVCLDTALRKKASTPLARAGLELSRVVVPVEIVTAPRDPSALIPDLDALMADLRAAGARGSRDGILFGFGVHLNVELPHPVFPPTGRIVTAYALMEDWLRARRPLDLSRRLLPFTDPYPRAFVDAMATAHPDVTQDALFDLYATHNDSRNRGLDMLPALRHLDPGRFAALFTADAAVKPRPAFHYRLPDCRIDEPGWSLASEWNAWALVERVAADARALSALASGWQAHRAALTTLRGDWAATSGEILARHGLDTPDGA